MTLPVRTSSSGLAANGNPAPMPAGAKRSNTACSRRCLSRSFALASVAEMWPHSSIPAELGWLGQQGDATVDGATLTVRAGPLTDWFNDPDNNSRTASAPVLCFDAFEDCQLSARVTVDFAATFDAGVLFVHQTDDDFAKLCFERSPQGENTVVSVVTRGASDDSNGPAIDGESVHLRVSKFRAVIAFHWSADAETWNLLRFFQFRDPNAPTSIGLSTQSPTGAGCTATFADVEYRTGAPADIRNGT